MSGRTNERIREKIPEDSNSLQNDLEDLRSGSSILISLGRRSDCV